MKNLHKDIEKLKNMYSGKNNFINYIEDYEINHKDGFNSSIRISFHT